MPGNTKEKVPLSTHLIAGGAAGLAEALAWLVGGIAELTEATRSTRSKSECSCPSPAKPVEYVCGRTRMIETYIGQLKPLGFFATGQQIVARETALGLYKGLGAVVSGIVPKMAIRFASFEREQSRRD